MTTDQYYAWHECQSERDQLRADLEREQERTERLRAVAYAIEVWLSGGDNNTGTRYTLRDELRAALAAYEPEGEGLDTKEKRHDTN